MIYNKKSLAFLNKKLSLPFIGIEQDWDIEMANSTRLNEFIVFYKQQVLSNDIKIPLMALILASYEDYLNELGLDNCEYWHLIKPLILKDKIIFHELIDYWSLKKETDKAKIFKLSILIREC